MRLTAAAGLIAAFVASALSQFGQQERCYSWPPRQTGKHANRATGLLAGVLARKRLCSIDVFAQDASYRQVAKYQHAKGANAGNDEDIPPFRSLDSKKQSKRLYFDAQIDNSFNDMLKASLDHISFIV